MKVSELIDQLLTFDPDLETFALGDHGWAHKFTGAYETAFIAESDYVYEEVAEEDIGTEFDEDEVIRGVMFRE